MITDLGVDNSLRKSACIPQAITKEKIIMKHRFILGFSRMRTGSFLNILDTKIK